LAGIFVSSSGGVTGSVENVVGRHFSDTQLCREIVTMDQSVENDTITSAVELSTTLAVAASKNNSGVLIVADPDPVATMVHDYFHQSVHPVQEMTTKKVEEEGGEPAMVDTSLKSDSVSTLDHAMHDMHETTISDAISQSSLPSASSPKPKSTSRLSVQLPKDQYSEVYADTISTSRAPCSSSGNSSPREISPLSVGDTCVVRWRNDERRLPAIVVARKPLGFRHSTATVTTTTLDDGVVTINLSATTGSSKKRKLNVLADNKDISSLVEQSIIATSATSNNNNNNNNINNFYTNLDSALRHYSADQVEYYVHYLGFDRRLDEWLTLDKFQLDTLVSNHGALPSTASTSTFNSGFNSGNSTPRSGNTTPRNIAAGPGPGPGPGPWSNATSQTPIRRSSSGSLTGLDDDNHTTHTITSHEFSMSGGNWHGTSSGHHRTSNDPALAAFEHEHDETTKVKNIDCIVMADWEIEAWYYSPFPAGYHDLHTLFVCEYCLTYYKNAKNYYRHCAECKLRQPPGTEIYRHDDLVAFELDGSVHKCFCQKLCLLAKLFLDHKTLYFDTTPFIFYVVAKVDEVGHCHMVGYFSKEKSSEQGYNLACILTFPHYQKVGVHVCETHHRNTKPIAVK
jgi:hypothetical protein